MYHPLSFAYLPEFCYKATACSAFNNKIIKWVLGLIPPPRLRNFQGRSCQLKLKYFMEFINNFLDHILKIRGPRWTPYEGDLMGQTDKAINRQPGWLLFQWGFSVCIKQQLSQGAGCASQGPEMKQRRIWSMSLFSAAGKTPVNGIPLD